MPEFLHAFLTSPWLLVVVLVVAALDAIVPLSPSETTVVAAGVAAASTGHPHPVWIIVAAAAGAYAGDRIAYQLGARGGTRLAGRVKRTARGRAAYDWARNTMRRRGGMVLLFARYLPLGRSASTIAAGTTGYPLARFRIWTALAVLLWASFATLLGYAGGAMFADQPWKGALIAYAAIAVVLGGVEAVRRYR